MGTRTPNGMGTLSRVTRGNGRQMWRAGESVALVEGARTVRIFGEGATPQAAKAALERNKVKRMVAVGSLPATALQHAPGVAVLTTGAWLHQWMRTKTKLGESTRAQYETRIRMYLEPKFGDIPLTLLTTEAIERFILDELPALTKKDGSRLLGDTAIRNIFIILSSALDAAVKRGKIPANPAKVIETPSRTRKNRERHQKLVQATRWVPQQLIKHLEGDDDEARWLVSLLGLRQMEALGLTDDSLKGKGANLRLVVNKQLARQHAKHGCGTNKQGKWECGRQADRCPERAAPTRIYLKEDLKTADGERTIPLVEPFAGALRRQLRKQQQLRKSPEFAPLPGAGMDTLLFTTATGRPRKPQTDGKEWKALLERSKVPYDLRGHDARHLTASVLLELGFANDVIQKILGWSPGTVSEMLAIYGHTGHAFLRPSMELLAEHYGQRRE